VTISKSGSLAIPAGCYYAEVTEQTRFYGPIGQSRSVVTLQDTQNMRLYYESKIPEVRATAPVLNFPEPPPIKPVSTDLFKPTVTFAPKASSSAAFQAYMGVAAIVVIVLFVIVFIGGCCAWRWKKQLNLVMTGFNGLTSLARPSFPGPAYAAVAAEEQRRIEQDALRPLPPPVEMAIIPRAPPPPPPTYMIPTGEARATHVTFAKPSPPQQQPILRAPARYVRAHDSYEDAIAEAEAYIAENRPPQASPRPMRVAAADLFRAAASHAVTAAAASHTPENARRYPPATRASFEEQEHAQSSPASRHQRKPSGSFAFRH
jgi:hypothetical protein